MYEVLDALFGDVDAYTSVLDPDESSWIGEPELRRRATIALRRLEKLANE